MLTTFVNGKKKDIVVAVQKSGFAWALDRDNGTLVWSTVIYILFQILFLVK
jgi:glucose dehydrogenase